MIMMLRRFRLWPDMCIAVLGGLVLGFVLFTTIDARFFSQPPLVAAEILTYEVSPTAVAPGDEIEVLVVSRRYIEGCRVSAHRQIEASDKVLVSFAAVDIVSTEQEPGVFETRTVVRIPQGLTPGPARMHSVAFYDCGARGTHTVLSPWADIYIRRAQ